MGSTLPENDDDKASRYAVNMDPPGFLSWLLGLPGERFVFRGWLNIRASPFPGDTERANETVARLENVTEHGVPWALAVEFQTHPDPDMFGRLLGYLSGLWLAVRPDEERGSWVSWNETWRPNLRPRCWPESKRERGRAACCRGWR